MKNQLRVVAIVATLIFSSGIVTPAAQATAFCPTINRNGVPSVNTKPTTNWTNCIVNKLNAQRRNLSKAQLIATNLNEANLEGATLTEANLTAASLDSANLKSADLSKANLSGAILRDAKLDRANLKSAKLAGVVSGGITGTPARLPTGWSLKAGYLLGPGASFGYIELTNVNLSSVDLTNATFGYANWRTVNLNGAKLRGADLTHVHASGLTGTPSSLPVGWVIRNGFLIGPGANLEEANLQGVTWANVNLTGVNSGYITGTPTSLPTGWKLLNGYLVGAGAVLNNGELIDQDLHGMNLTNAKMQGVNLTGANLTDTDLSGADLTGITSSGIIGRPSHLPTGWILVNGYLVGPQANFSGDAQDIFSDANLAGADLSGIQIWQSRYGTPATLPAKFRISGDRLIGPRSDLSSLDFTDEDFGSTDLTGSFFDNTNLAGADLSLATLDGVSGSITGTPKAMPAGWKVSNGVLIGPKANLRFVTLAGNLSGADLRGVDLTAVFSSGITVAPAHLPAGWKVVKGFLVGPGANLSGADLSNADLTGVNLTGANLNETKLTRAKLAGAKLSGVSAVRITGVPKTLPRSWSAINGILYGPGVRLTAAGGGGGGCGRNFLPNLNSEIKSMKFLQGGSHDLPSYGCLVAN